MDPDLSVRGGPGKKDTSRYDTKIVTFSFHHPPPQKKQQKKRNPWTSAVSATHKKYPENDSASTPPNFLVDEKLHVSVYVSSKIGLWALNNFSYSGEFN